MLNNVDVGVLATVAFVDVGLEVSWGEVDGVGLVAESTRVKLVLMTKAVTKVGGWLVWVCLLEVES